MDRTVYLPLTTKQTAILVIYGAVLWFGAAMLVRATAAGGALDGSARLLTYVLVVPGTIPAVWLGQRLASLARQQLPVGLAVATATALLLDGVALAWFPWLYGSDPRVLLGGAAVILWGAGVGLVLGFVMGRNG